MFVCLSPINAKTAALINPKMFEVAQNTPNRSGLRISHAKGFSSGKGHGWLKV